MCDPRLKDGKRPRRQRWTVLGSKVLAVAKEGYCGDWAAYVGVVPGKCFDDEWQEVLSNGDKLRKEVAEVLFPDFAKDLIWRY